MIGAALVIGACQSPAPTPAALRPTPAAATLAPGRLVVPEPGSTYLFRKRDGGEVASRVVAVEGDDVTWQSDDGWTWTNKAFYWPVERWQGDSVVGSQEVSGDFEALLPLLIGERAAYRYQGRRQDGQGWSGQGRCDVAAAEQITVPAGTFDTYKVVCEQGEDPKQPYHGRTWWYAPAVGHYVAVLRQTRDGRLNELEELVSYRAG
jgi:hypothetical protein